MSATQKHVRVTIKQYLDSEKVGEQRHEYVDGHLYAMVGGTLAHNIITRNIARRIDDAVSGSACQVFTSDVKVRTASAFYYPDVVVNCESTDLGRDFISTPKLIVEVLSPSTERTDSVEKLAAYQSLESVQEYVLVSQERLEVQIYQRARKGWKAKTYTESDTVRFKSIDCEVLVESIFADVK